MSRQPKNLSRNDVALDLVGPAVDRRYQGVHEGRQRRDSLLPDPHAPPCANGGENPDFDYIAGSTGNAALMAFTRALGGRSLEHGIRVVGVNPGPVGTARLLAVLQRKLQPGRELAQLLQGYPLQRPATVEEIADIFPFLASPRSGYTSGAVFTIDGGITARRSI